MHIENKKIQYVLLPIRFIYRPGRMWSGGHDVKEMNAIQTELNLSLAVQEVGQYHTEFAASSFVFAGPSPSCRLLPSSMEQEDRTS
jgi:hypothetical protein